MASARVELLCAVAHTLPNDSAKIGTHLYCAWHDSIAGLLFYGPATRMAGLTSRHADGSFISGVMNAVNMKPVRGSTRHGGASALAELIQTSKDYDIAITPDGPRGPRRQLKDGIVYLASVTGMPIIPVTLSCVNAWRPRGRWTDLTVPKPLARAWFLCGAPISIPSRIARHQVREYCELLQATMDEQQEFGDTIATQRAATPPAGFAAGFYRSGDDSLSTWRSVGVNTLAASRPELRLLASSDLTIKQAA
jgi:lysophospholipid acyltransferase (LPLAT)-like uncharacterized protein